MEADSLVDVPVDEESLDFHLEELEVGPQSLECLELESSSSLSFRTFWKINEYEKSDLSSQVSESYGIQKAPT